MSLFALLLATAVPTGNSDNWITTEDYPVRALREGVEGKSTVMLAISPDGKPIGCQISVSSGSAELDTAACSLLMDRARFETSSSGTNQSFSTAIEWKIPPAPLMPISAIGFAALTSLSKGKVVGNCQSTTIGQPDEQLDMCELLTTPGATETMGFANFSEATKLQMRLIIAPKDGPLPALFAFSSNARTVVLFKAQFDVDARGTPGNCTVLENIMDPEIDNLCDEMVSSGPVFDIANAKELPATMEFVIDATAGTPE
jgi:TonB family protein